MVSPTRRQQWANVRPLDQSVRVICSSLSTFTLHLPISVLNNWLFLNRPWLMMSNPKIPSNTVFVLSYSRATSFHSCLPCFTLTGTACLPPRHQRDWRGLTNAAAQWITMSRNDALKKNSKREGCCHALWPSFSLFHTSVSPLPPPCFPAFMLIVSAEREHREWHTVQNRWHNLSLSRSETLSLTLSPSVGVVKGSLVTDKDWGCKYN